MKNGFRKNPVGEKTIAGAIKDQFGAIKDQRDDRGLAVGVDIVSKMDAGQRASAEELANSIGADFVSAIHMFSGEGPVGLALSRVAPTVAGDSSVVVPTLKFLSSTGDDTQLLLAAMFDPKFQKSLYYFQLLLSRSKLEEQQKLIKRFATIDWGKFNIVDQNWFTRSFGLIEAGRERSKVNDINLQDVIPLMKVPCVLDMITIAVGYAKMMDSALTAYKEDRNFLMQMGDDNTELLVEIDALIEVIQKKEDSRLVRLANVTDEMGKLDILMSNATLIADLTNRSIEAEAQKQAGHRVEEALRLHTQDTLESQEAYLGQFMRLNQILVSNQVREGRLSSAMAALNLYVKSYQAFVLMLTAEQVYLLSASAALKSYMSKTLEGSNRTLVAEIYRRHVGTLNFSMKKYASDYSRIKPGQSRRTSMDAVAMIG